jgi:hypothetical protein
MWGSAFLTPALNWGEWSGSRPGYFAPVEGVLSIHCIWGWVGLTVGPDSVEKRSICFYCWESNHRYADWDISAPPLQRLRVHLLKYLRNSEILTHIQSLVSKRTSAPIHIHCSKFNFFRVYLIYQHSRVKEKKKSYPCNRPWRPIGLWDVEDPTFSRQSVHRLRCGCQPYAPNYPCNRPWRPIGLWDVEAPTISLDNRLTDGGKVVSLTRRPPLTSEEDSWYSFLLEAESTSGP